MILLLKWFLRRQQLRQTSSFPNSCCKMVPRRTVFWSVCLAMAVSASPATTATIVFRVSVSITSEIVSAPNRVLRNAPPAGPVNQLKWVDQTSSMSVSRASECSAARAPTTPIVSALQARRTSASTMESGAGSVELPASKAQIARRAMNARTRWPPVKASSSNVSIQAANVSVHRSPSNWLYRRSARARTTTVVAPASGSARKPVSPTAMPFSLHRRFVTVSTTTATAKSMNRPAMMPIPVPKISVLGPTAAVTCR